MIRLRNDDVLVPSSQWKDPLARFATIHEWTMLCPSMVHVPAILCGELQKFPDAVRYIREQTADGLMLPEVHGWWHEGYPKMTQAQAARDLSLCIEWIEVELGRRPRIWYTPRGSSEPHLHAAAKSVGLELVDTSAILPIERVCRQLRSGEITVASIRDAEIFMHWWESGERLKRLALAVKHGSWSDAAREHPELFGD